MFNRVMRYLSLIIRPRMTHMTGGSSYSTHSRDHENPRNDQYGRIRSVIVC